MNPEIKTALDYCRSRQIRQILLAIPFSLSMQELEELRKDPRIQGVIVRYPSAELWKTFTAGWLGAYLPDARVWILPRERGKRKSGKLVFAGSRMLITPRMLQAALLNGKCSLIYRNASAYCSSSLYRFSLWWLSDYIVAMLRHAHPSHPLMGLIKMCCRIPAARYVWHRVFRWGPDHQRPIPMSKGSFKEPAVSNGLSGSSPMAIEDETQRESSEQLFRELIRRATDSARACGQNRFVPGRVVLVNSGLAAGGAERQLVNTLIGLKTTASLESVILLAEYLHASPDMSFYLPQLQTAGVPVHQVRSAAKYGDTHIVSPDLAELLDLIPQHLTAEILNLASEFRSRRPEIVHAWQDSTSIKAGIAAMIAGVPRVLVSSRNVSPPHFAYHQDYMRCAYRAMADWWNITFINNSNAGAQDYAQWLDLPVSRFRIIRNGVDLSSLTPASSLLVEQFKARHNIPVGVPIVGSIFRFWPEKRPLLWLETAAYVSKQRTDVHFLVVGWGPMRREMEALIKKQKLSERIHIVDAQNEIAAPLSCMNVFLLTAQYEGTPNVLLESQWLGIPVVATDSGGTKEAVDEGLTGWISPMAKPDCIGQLILDILEKASFAERVRIEGPAFIRQRYGVSKMLRETLDAYGYADLAPKEHTAALNEEARNKASVAISEGTNGNVVEKANPICDSMEETEPLVP